MNQHQEDQIIETIEQENEEPKRKNNIRIWILSSVGILILFSIAAFFAGRFINSQSRTGGFDILGPGNNTTGMVIEMDLETDENLPQTPPVMFGMFLSIEDNIIKIAEPDPNGEIITIDENGDVDFSQSAKGPEIEIVVNKDTKIYRDATFDDQEGFPESGESIQQKSEESSIDEIKNGSSLTVWGRKSGDRIIADIILFSSPFLFTSTK